MAIQSINAGNVGSTVPQAKSANKNIIDTKNQSMGSTASTDTVNITPGINNASNAGPATPIVDENRVANIKAALQSGAYEIDPERIAKKLLQFDQQLISDTT